MHSSSNSSTGVNYHLDENKSHTHARKWSSATTSSCSADSSKESPSLYRRKWIDEDTWRQWAAFLEVVAAHPVFREVHQSSREMFNKPFQDYVSGILGRKK